jgi:hypothetical protein
MGKKKSKNGKKKIQKWKKKNPKMVQNSVPVLF